MRALISIFSLIAFIFVSCDGSRTRYEGEIDTTVVASYADWLVVREELSQRGLDSSEINRNLDSVLEFHGLNRDEFERRLRGYSKDLHRWKEFNERVLNRLEDLQRRNAPGPEP